MCRRSVDIVHAVSSDAKPVAEATPTDGGDCARVEAERHEESATGVSREGIRGSRPIKSRLIPSSFSQGLTLEIGNIIRRHKMPNLDTHLIYCLQFNWHLMVASEHLLERALVRTFNTFFDMARSGEHPELLRDYYGPHLQEERGHADWLKADLETFDVRMKPDHCPVGAATLVGMVMYFVEFVDPCALLGYQLLMESFPLPTATLERLEDLYGTELLRTTRYHSTHDVSHAADLRAVIDQLSERQQRLVRYVAVATTSLFASYSEEIAGMAPMIVGRGK